MKLSFCFLLLCLSISAFASEKDPSANKDDCTMAREAYQKQVQKSSELYKRLREIEGNTNCEDVYISVSSEGGNEHDAILRRIQESNEQLARISNEMARACSGRRPEP